MKGTLDNFGPDSREISFDCTDGNQASHWVGRLDGKVHTMLSLGDSSGWTLMVGGGPEWYVIVKSNAQGNSWTRINPVAELGAPIELSPGGQLAEFDRMIVCSLVQTTEAVWEFFEAPSELGWPWKQD